MKKIYVFAFLLGTFLSSLSAQDFKGGTVIYEQIINYQLEDAFDDPRWTEYIADLPKSGKSYYTLSFSTGQALYQEDLSKKEVVPSKLRGALSKASYGQAPQPQTMAFFYDFNKNEKTRQVEFMTRYFLVESEIERTPWKLTTRKKKVLDYICLGADLEINGDTYTAWFTSEIPSSAGPGKYYGLPGLILGVEKNGEVFILATSVDLSAPEKEAIAPPKKGQKYNEEKFEELVVEKTKEYEARIKAKKAGGRKSKSKN